MRPHQSTEEHIARIASVPAELNSELMIGDIVRIFYPEGVRADRLWTLWLVRWPPTARYDQPCTRCGGTVYCIYGPRIGKVQCVTCRAFVYTRAGHLDELKILEKA